MEMKVRSNQQKEQMFAPEPFTRGFYSTPACDILGSVTGKKSGKNQLKDPNQNIKTDFTGGVLCILQ